MLYCIPNEIKVFLESGASFSLPEFVFTAAIRNEQVF